MSSIKFLTIKEVADALQVSERTIHRCIKNGTIPARRVGTQWRIPLSYLIEEGLDKADAKETNEE